MKNELKFGICSWHTQRSCLFGSQSKNPFANLSDSFADLLKENQFSSSFMCHCKRKLNFKDCLLAFFDFMGGSSWYGIIEKGSFIPFTVYKIYLLFVIYDQLKTKRVSPPAKELFFHGVVKRILALDWPDQGLLTVLVSPGLILIDSRRNSRKYFQKVFSDFFIFFCNWVFLQTRTLCVLKEYVSVCPSPYYCLYLVWLVFITCPQT